MYPDEMQRAGFTTEPQLRGLGAEMACDAGQVQQALERVKGIANLLSGTNESFQFALDRLTGGFPVKGQITQAGGSPPAMGQLGALLNALDDLYNIASRTSEYVGPLSRI